VSGWLPVARAAILGTALLIGVAARAADYPAPVEGDFALKDFRFASGETLPELRLHYRTIGKIERGANGAVRNAVLILHGTGGDGTSLMRDIFAAELFGAGQPLDATRFFLVLPDGIGHGKSSKPSDGLRAKFPRYGYRDMIEAQRRLLVEGLGVDHLRLVMGTSMGGMHTWLWGQAHPGFMDALLPLASLPAQISGRNRMWRRIAIDAIRNDPEWRGGAYTSAPRGLRTAAQVLYIMGGNPLTHQKAGPTLVDADRAFDSGTAAMLGRLDANDLLYALEASHDYDPAPGLERIRAPLLAINFADDLINPPELGILEREIRRVPRGRAIVIPGSEVTAGHQTHTRAAVWKAHLEAFLRELEAGTPGARTASLKNHGPTEARMELVGKRLRLRYDSGLEVIGHYRSDTHLDWEGLSGPARGTKGSETMHLAQVAPHVFFASWLEKGGASVSQVLDLERMQVTSFVTYETDKGRQGTFDRGTITEL
jgi:homoserine O-acetyltransferase